MSTASNLHVLVGNLRSKACADIPGLEERWAKNVITERGEILLADALRRHLSKIFMPNSGDAFKFTYDINRGPLAGIQDCIDMHFGLLFPFTQRDVYDLGVQLSFNQAGDLICRTTDDFSGQEIPENITNWKL